MIGGRAMMLLGFAWHARMRPGSVARSGTGPGRGPWRSASSRGTRPSRVRDFAPPPDGLAPGEPSA